MRFDENRRWGVEIEFTRANPEDVAREMRNRGVECYQEGYNHVTRRHWKVVSDASCGWELVSPPLKGEEGFRQLKIACEALKAAGAKVDRRCGLHVHHDANDFDVNTFKRLYSLYIRFEGTIDELVPQSRRANNNGYCCSLRTRYVLNRIREARHVEDILNIFGSRCLKLNCQSYRRHGTVEFRQHSGTTEYKKIKNWIILTQAMVNRAVDGQVQVPTRVNYNTDTWYHFKKYLKLIGCKGASEEIQEVTKFYNKRRQQLAERTAA